MRKTKINNKGDVDRKPISPLFHFTVVVVTTLIGLSLLSTIVMVIYLDKTVPESFINSLSITFAVGVGYFIAQAGGKSSVAKAKSTYPKLSIVAIMLQTKIHSFSKLYVFLFTTVITSSLFASMFNQPISSLIAGILLVAVFILVVKNKVFEYRIRNGFFGNNESEARDIVRFIDKSHSNIDLTGKGTPKPIISESDLKKLVETWGLDQAEAI